MITLEEPHIFPRILGRNLNVMVVEECLQSKNRSHRSMVHGGAGPIQHDCGDPNVIFHRAPSVCRAIASAPTPKLSVMPAPPRPVTTSTPSSGWKRTYGWSKCFA